MPDNRVPWRHGSAAGYIARRCRCPECVGWMRAYNRARFHTQRRPWFEGKVCAHCGGTDRLQLDHIDPATKSPKLGRNGTFQNIWAWPDAAEREAELAKCQPLCRRCHYDKSAVEKIKLTDEEVLMAIEVHRQGGVTWEQLAGVLGVTVGTLKRWRNRLDF